MRGKKRFAYLLVIMVLVASAVGGTALYALYKTALEQQRMRLLEIAHGRARLIEAIARFAFMYSEDELPGGTVEATLSQVREAHRNFAGFGKTGEFVLGRRNGDWIEFLLSHRHHDLENPHPIAFSSREGEPMRRALSGKSGTMVGLDYRGVRVLAAYEPVSVVNLGIVAKIDLAEIREPFIHAGLEIAGIAVALVLLGALFFIRIGNPMVRHLEESERKYRGLFESAGDAIIVMGLDGTVLEANEPFYSASGYSSDEVLGERITKIIHPDQRPSFLRAMEQTPEGDSLLLECQHMRKDGNELFVEARLSRVLHRGRQAVLAVVRDITDRKRAEEERRIGHEELERTVQARTRELTETNEALHREILDRQRAELELQENQRMLQSVFDGISDPLVLLDSDLKVKMLNKAARNYYRMCKEGEAVGRPCHEGLMGKPEPCARCFVLPNILNGRAGSFERRGLMDQDRLEEVVIYPLKEDVKSSGAIVRISDITEKSLLERRIIQNEKLTVLGLLVASIAHDINNPNNFISFNIPILREYVNELLPIVDDYAEKHPGYELFGMSYENFRKDLLRLLDNVEHGSNRIKDFVSDLREFVRKRQKREESYVDLGDVVDRAVVICRPEITKKVRDLNVSVQEDLPKTLTSADELELVLVHLLINAAHAADKEDSWIGLRVFAQDALCIEVSDNGCGMDEATRKKAFDPLFSTKSSTDGFGLGLYVCDNIITGLGGRIEVESEPGKGSTFRLLFKEPRFEEAQGGRLIQTAR